MVEFNEDFKRKPRHDVKEEERNKLGTERQSSSACIVNERTKLKVPGGLTLLHSDALISSIY